MLRIKILILMVQILTALSVIMLILIQNGKGADMNITFNSSSTSLFSVSSSANFLSRFTAILATIFFLSTLGLTYTNNIYHHTTLTKINKSSNK